MSIDWRIDTRGAVDRGRKFTISVDGQDLSAFDGETISTVLLAGGRRTFRYTSRNESPRGVYCGMGVCFDCLVEVDGEPNVRACMTPAKPGMQVRTQRGPSGPVSPVPSWGDDDE